MEKESGTGVEKKRVVVVIPTYNEKDNINALIDAVLLQQVSLQNSVLYVLIVDDLSPDGTGEIVETLAAQNQYIHILHGKKRGLGMAYKKGFSYALHKLHADIVFEMDADFSHDPNDIPRFVDEIISHNADFVIGSRYVPGGSVPNTWPMTRKLNSRFGNLFAKHLAGITKVKDCTSGYRAISAHLLRKIPLLQLSAKGYAFQIDLLHRAKKKNAIISEIPIQFVDRVNGISKLSLHDVIEFVVHCFYIRMPLVFYATEFLLFLLLGAILGAGVAYVLHQGVRIALMVGIGLATTGMILQAGMNIYWMLYAWSSGENKTRTVEKQDMLDPKFSFTALIPARHESLVIADTLRAIAKMDYPQNLQQTIVICKTDDTQTIREVEKTLAEIGKPSMQLVTFSNDPVNKPHALNVGLAHATNDVVCVFDAEDEINKHIYSVCNTVMQRERTDIVQCGVGLMNFRSSWFATLNVLEYFFWFKSALHAFTQMGVVPLGGNSVFIKKHCLDRVRGWDETCLTEDAEIGLRLSSLGETIRVVYNETYTTKEECPTTIGSFIKQRTRWNQGFLQTFLKGDWTELPKFSQRLLAGYILLSPEIQGLLFLYVPISFVISFYFKLPVLLAMYSLVPLYLLLFQVSLYCVGMYLFAKEYHVKSPWWIYGKILVTFFPFQMLLNFSALRGVLRILLGKSSWEKTHHANVHRITVQFATNS